MARFEIRVMQYISAGADVIAKELSSYFYPTRDGAEVMFEDEVCFFDPTPYQSDSIMIDVDFRIHDYDPIRKLDHVKVVKSTTIFASEEVKPNGIHRV